MDDHDASNGDGNVALDAEVSEGHEPVASPVTEVGGEPMIGSAGGETTDSPEIAATGERAARTEQPVLLEAYHASYSDRETRDALRRDPRVVIGPDGRTRITNTHQYPWRAIAALLITAPDGSRYIGTAWFVSPRLLLTAGHNVYMHDEGGWAKSVQIVPGRNGTDQPYGSVTISSYRSTIGWTRDKKSGYDYGALLLPAASPLGTTVGWFGYEARSDANLRGMTVNIAGYPADKGGTTMWWMADPITDVRPLSFSYKLDTAGGHSGAPAFMQFPDRGRIGVGVHTYGALTGNSATRLTDAVLRNVNAWKAEV